MPLATIKDLLRQRTILMGTINDQAVELEKLARRNKQLELLLKLAKGKERKPHGVGK